MTNAEQILSLLDSELTSRVELTLYGRAALYLGFPNAPRDHALSRDVDAVLWLGQAEELNQRAIALARDIHGDSHPDLAWALHLQGLLRTAENRDDDAEVAWKVLNHIDPQRDLEFTLRPMEALDHASRAACYGSKVGIDATRKWPEEGFTREWPDEIVMSSAVKAAVESRWADFGLGG